MPRARSQRRLAPAELEPARRAARAASDQSAAGVHGRTAEAVAHQATALLALHRHDPFRRRHPAAEGASHHETANQRAPAQERGTGSASTSLQSIRCGGTPMPFGALFAVLHGLIKDCWQAVPVSTFTSMVTLLNQDSIGKSNGTHGASMLMASCKKTSAPGTSGITRAGG